MSDWLEDTNCKCTPGSNPAFRRQLEINKALEAIELNYSDIEMLAGMYDAERGIEKDYVAYNFSQSGLQDRESSFSDLEDLSFSDYSNNATLRGERQPAGMFLDSDSFDSIDMRVETTYFQAELSTLCVVSLGRNRSASATNI